MIFPGLEMFHQTIDQAQPGDQLGVLLKNVRKEDIRRGVFVGKPGSLKMHNKFDCQVKQPISSRRISHKNIFSLDLFLIQRRRRSRRTYTERIFFNNVLSNIWYWCERCRTRRTWNDHAWWRCNCDLVYQQTNGLSLILSKRQEIHDGRFRLWKKVLDLLCVMQITKRLELVLSPLYIPIHHRMNWRNSGNELLRKRTFWCVL